MNKFIRIAAIIVSLAMLFPALSTARMTSQSQPMDESNMEEMHKMMPRMMRDMMEMMREMMGMMKGGVGSGHHRSAILRFNGADVSKVTAIDLVILVIKDLVGIKERSFRFEIKR